MAISPTVDILMPQSSGRRAKGSAARSNETDAPDLLQLIANERSTNRALRMVRTAFDAKHLAFVLARYGNEPAKDPYVKTTYPATWMARYIFRRYWRVDPVIRAGFARARPFDWREIDRTDPAVATFFADAADHGIGQSGLLIPTTNKQGQRGVLSINSDLTGDDWAAYKRQHLPAFLEVAQGLHRRGIKELFGDMGPPPKLSPREQEVLAWVAEGKEVPDIEIITGLSQHTIRTYLKGARGKLDCGTTAQAAVKAERLGLLGGVTERD